MEKAAIIQSWNTVHSNLLCKILVTSPRLFGDQNAFWYAFWFQNVSGRERPQNSQVKEEGAKETDKGMRTAFRLFFENISIAFQSLKTLSSPECRSKTEH